MTLAQPRWRGTDWRVWTARLVWLFVLVLTVSMLIVNAPHNATFVRNDWQVAATRPLLAPFISPFTFAEWLVALNWLAIVIYFAVALLIAWRRADDWYALLLSAALIWAATLLPSLLIALLGQLYRYRVVATPIQRQQVKWVLLGMAGVLLFALFGLGFIGNTPWTALLSIALQFVVMILLPIALGFSILRYRLWDIDIVINRTLVFGGLTFLVAAVYVLVVGVLGVLFQAGNNLLISILATGLIAILFNPLRQRLQGSVNRLLYGDRDDPVTVLSRLGKQLEVAATPDAILPTLVDTVAQALKLPYVAVVAKEEGLEGEVIAHHGPPTGQTTSFLLAYQGQSVVELLVAPRSHGESFSPREQELLRDIARRASAAVYAAQLTTRLQHSREQLVLTREEERRRLQRDLHDGLGPQLAGLSLKLDAARNLVQRDPDAADQLLSELKAQTQTAITDIRRLVYDLRPPALDQLGLVSALKEYAASHNGNGRLQITIDAPPLMPPLPAAVEVAAYRIATEAMTNVIRHAAAHHCIVRL